MKANLLLSKLPQMTLSNANLRQHVHQVAIDLLERDILLTKIIFIIFYFRCFIVILLILALHVAPNSWLPYIFLLDTLVELGMTLKSLKLCLITRCSILVGQPPSRIIDCLSLKF